MEVHQHTHTPRKKWTHYFWEFLMLFLAVFCGFLAENQREHFVEHNRERQFIKALLYDLKLDSVEFDTVIRSQRTRLARIDSALKDLARSQNGQLTVKLYLLLRSSLSQYQFYPNNGTLTQLRNSGGMRLIGKRSVVDAIEGYDRQMRRLEYRREVDRTNIDNLYLSLNKLFSGRQVYNVLYDSTMFDKADHKSFIKINTEFLDEFIHQMINMQRQVDADIGRYDGVFKRSLRIMSHLKEEYRIK